MNRDTKIAIIEEYVKELEYKYRVLKRTSKLFIIDDEEIMKVNLWLKDMKKTLDSIKNCKDFEELNKYIKVKKVLKDYKSKVIKK